MAKNEIAKKGNTTPTYSQKNFDSVDVVNETDIHRETYEPSKTTIEDIHSTTVVSSKSSSKKK